MSKPLISYQNVSIFYGTTEVIKNVSFDIFKNDFLNIIGPNGAGKTTLIKSLIKLIKPQQGIITINTDKIGYVPQKISAKQNFPLTVLELIYTGYKNPKLRIDDESKKVIESWLVKMELKPEILNEKVSHLSGGQLQRVYLIRSLMNDPEVLILDEPASALDHSFREKFYVLLNEIKIEKQMTIIHITHDLTDVVMDHSKVLCMDQVVKFLGSYDEFKSFEHEGHHHG